MNDTKKESLVRERLKKDLEAIFDKSMESEKLNVALKAREYLAKLEGIFLGAGEKGRGGQRVKPLSQWSEEELKDFLTQIEGEDP
jgi:hypothetical protein